MTTFSLPDNLKNLHIHFVGIKGTGMVALVEIFYHNGAIITGSDVSERFYTDEILEKLNIKPLPFSESNITDDIDFVVYSSAYKLDKNQDLISAVQKNIPCLMYTEALGLYSAKAYSCGICGVHGKTSTTGLTGTILKELPLPAQVLAGSVINSFGGTCTYTSPRISDCPQIQYSEKKSDAPQIPYADTKPKYFIAETCEYQRHFMSFCPQKIILTSVEPDHEDYYPTYEDIRDAFVDYVMKLPNGGDLIYCADDKGAVEVSEIAKSKRADINFIPYGEKAEGDFKLTFKGVENERNRFNISSLGDFELKVPGKHEVMDACGAVALCVRLLQTAPEFPEQKNNSPNVSEFPEQIDNPPNAPEFPEQIKVAPNTSVQIGEYIPAIKTGLLNFSGGKRRSEIIGEFKNKNGKSVLVIDDYGHHPTAVNTTLSGYREFYKGRKIIVDFMSHTYSRTQALLKEFGESFGSADSVILHKIYSSARENLSDFNITGKTLFDEVKKHKDNVAYFEEILDAFDFAVEELNKPLEDKYSDGYLFVTMGAGDNWKLGKKLLELK